MLICAVCGDCFPFHAPCTQAHDGFCHSCAELNWSGTLGDNPAHDAPPPPSFPPPVRAVLDAATAAALDAYAAHVQRTEAAVGRASQPTHGERS
jgi:hypothetical protein